MKDTIFKSIIKFRIIFIYIYSLLFVVALSTNTHSSETNGDGNITGDRNVTGDKNQICESGAFCIFPGSNNSPNNNLSTIFPEEFIGMWKGIGSQSTSINNKKYTVSLSLKAGSINSVLGNIQYPELNCGGVLTLLEASQTSLILSESITFGNKRCTNNGKVNLVMSETNYIDYYWSRSDSKTITVTGKLKKDSY